MVRAGKFEPLTQWLICVYATNIESDGFEMSPRISSVSVSIHYGSSFNLRFKALDDRQLPSYGDTNLSLFRNSLLEPSSSTVEISSRQVCGSIRFPSRAAA